MILQKNTANRLGIFVFYDKDGIADEYNFYFIEELKKTGQQTSGYLQWRRGGRKTFFQDCG